MQKTALRLLLSGQFYNRGLVAQVSKFVDDGLLDIGKLALVPNSEAGLLTQIRILIRAGLNIRAAERLEHLFAQFGTGVEADYYATLLRRLA
jgi:hypothetical protein